MSRFNTYWNRRKREREEWEKNIKDRMEVEMQTTQHLCIMAPMAEKLFAMEPPITRTYIYRNRAERHAELMQDYFHDNHRFPDSYFRRRFRMNRQLFERLVESVENANPYFRQRPDCTGRLGLSPIQKVMAAIRVLAYGYCFDSLDEIIKIGEKTAKDCTINFCDTIIALFQARYLRDPTTEDLARLMEENKERGFPGMIGSLDCMHWRWDACPHGWRGVYNGRYGCPTLILEAVASRDLWIWHAFFGMAGTNNDRTVLEHSDLFTRHINGTAPQVEFEVNGHHYNMPYYLTDGIYPKYATLIQAINKPITPKEALFTRIQESLRKHIERAFGVIQRKWHILHNPARIEKTSDLLRIMLTCLILHSMIIEDERGQGLDDWSPPDEDASRVPEMLHTTEQHAALLRARLGRIRNRDTNERLQKDLVDHLWMRYGGIGVAP